MRKKGRLVGFLQGLSFSARMGEVSTLVMLQKIKETEEWKSEGFETWKDFAKEATCGSYETLNRRLNEIKALGVEVTGIMVSLDLGIKDVRMIEHAMMDDPKTGKKVLKVNDEGTTIPFTEDRIDEIQSHIDIIRKKGKLAERKLTSMDQEHKKELKNALAEVEDLKKMMPPESEDEDALEAWVTDMLSIIDEKHKALDLAMRKLAFHQKILTNPLLQAKIQGMHEEFSKRAQQFSDNFDEQLLGETE